MLYPNSNICCLPNALGYSTSNALVHLIRSPWTSFPMLSIRYILAQSVLNLLLLSSIPPPLTNDRIIFPHMLHCKLWIPVSVDSTKHTALWQLRSEELHPAFSRSDVPHSALYFQWLCRVRTRWKFVLKSDSSIHENKIQGSQNLHTRRMVHWVKSQSLKVT